MRTSPPLLEFEGTLAKASGAGSITEIRCDTPAPIETHGMVLRETRWQSRYYMDISSRYSGP
jgi:hypothetical protein